jgi:uncharacterized protein
MQGPAQVRFMIDHMLIKLGKYLRILGYDADWDGSLRTHELILRANADQRVFLTRNTRLDQYPPAWKSIVISSTDPVAQLNQIVAACELDPVSEAFSKCIRCNVRLDAVDDKKMIEGRVHPNVYARHALFYTCPCCHTVFWKGSHVANTSRKLVLQLAGLQAGPCPGPL